MESNFTYNFPAVKGLQAGTEYFVAMCPLKLIPKIFLFNDDVLPPQYRAQRMINKSRIPEMVKYIIDNPSDYVFSSLTASIDGDAEFHPISIESPNIGFLVVSMEASFIINDGQHRRAAIEEAIKIHTDLNSETISVVFYRDKGLQKSQQMFSDLNKHAINTTKSIGILYDSRDQLATVTKDIINQVPLLRKFTDMESSSLSKYSPKLFTLSGIYDTNNQLIKKQKKITAKDIKTLLTFWVTLCNGMSEWKQVNDKALSASNLRLNYIHTHGVVLAAIGMVGHYLLVNKYSDWTQYIESLDTLDWSRTNLIDWQGRSIRGNGNISKSNNNITLTCIKIKQKLNLPLSSDEELQESNFNKGGK